jgi:hypothetical protein
MSGRIPDTGTENSWMSGLSEGITTKVQRQIFLNVNSSEDNKMHNALKLKANFDTYGLFKIIISKDLQMLSQ